MDIPIYTASQLVICNRKYESSNLQLYSQSQLQYLVVFVQHFGLSDYCQFVVTVVYRQLQLAALYNKQLAVQCILHGPKNSNSIWISNAATACTWLQLVISVFQNTQLQQRRQPITKVASYYSYTLYLAQSYSCTSA